MLLEPAGGEGGQGGPWVLVKGTESSHLSVLPGGQLLQRVVSFLKGKYTLL